MLIRSSQIDVAASEITPREVYEKRREFMIAGGMMALAAGLPEMASAASLPGVKKSIYTLDEKNSSRKDITSYNNYYEFGTSKSDPADNAGPFKTSPWVVSVDGLCNKPRKFSLDELLKVAPLEERVYRLRCVEGWSMVIPWVGFPISALLKLVEPQGSAKYVEFTTAVDKKTMVGLASGGLDWPYREGLRLDEAMHPLAILAVGLYGETLPNQNGAPIRLVVPWKYGFKSAKSLVRIRLTDTQPATAWNSAQPSEYGFYSNVNPEVDHPRWSQATERRIGEFSRRKTLMFNGYAEQVASLYKGMDLKKFF